MDWLMGINFWGVVNVTRAFLPHLEKQPAAHIANLSSVFGIVAARADGLCGREVCRARIFRGSEARTCPAQQPCAPQRGAPRRDRHGDRAQCPCGCLHDRQRPTLESVDRFEALAKTTPDEAARVILDGIAADKPRILIGSDARWLDILQRLFPGTYWARAQKQMEKNLARLQKGGAQ